MNTENKIEIKNVLAGLGAGLLFIFLVLFTFLGFAGTGGLVASIIGEGHEEIASIELNTEERPCNGDYGDACITIIKDLVPDNQNDKINFRIFRTDGNEIIDEFIMSDPGANTHNTGVVSEEDNQSIEYTISEIFGPRITQWPRYETSITCSNGVNTPNGSLINLNLNKNEKVTCTFTNKKRTEFIIIKDVEPGVSSDVFPFLLEFPFGLTDKYLWKFNLDDDGDNNNQYSNKSPSLYVIDTFNANAYIIREKIDRTKYGTPSYYCDLYNSDGGLEGHPSGDLSLDSTNKDYNYSVPFTITHGTTLICTITNHLRTGKITIIKFVDPQDASPIFDFNLYQGVAPNSLTIIKPPSPISLHDTNDSGQITLTSLLDYTIEEAPSTVPGKSYDTKYVCSFEPARTTGDISGTGKSVEIKNLGYDENVTCNFTNTRKPATIIVRKILEPSKTTTIFPFDITGNDVSDKDFELKDGMSKVLEINRQFISSPSQNYSIEELKDQRDTRFGYQTSWFCTFTPGENGKQRPQANGSFIDPNEPYKIDLVLDTGENADCTFKNVKINPSILTVIKDTVPDSPNLFRFNLYDYVTDPKNNPPIKIFDLSNDGHGSKNISDPMRITSGQDHSIVEILRSTNDGKNYITTSKCVFSPYRAPITGNNTLDINLGPGEKATCTFKNCASNIDCPVYKKGTAGGGANVGDNNTIQ